MGMFSNLFKKPNVDQPQPDASTASSAGDASQPVDAVNPITGEPVTPVTSDASVSDAAVSPQSVNAAQPVPPAVESQSAPDLSQVDPVSPATEGQPVESASEVPAPESEPNPPASDDSQPLV